MKTIYRLTLLLPLTLFMLAGCKGRANASKSTSSTSNQAITINIKNEPHTLDPRKARALSDMSLIRMFMEGLTRPDKDGNVSLALAKSIEVSPDQKTYTFNLKKSHWSNGDPVTSHDFAYAWKKSLSPNFNAPNCNMLYVIKNAKKAKTGQLPLSLVGIETPNPQTLVVQLNHPTPYFKELTSNPIFFPVNSSVDSFDPHWAENHKTFIGNGPFLLHEWKHHNLMHAKKNEKYWEKKVVKMQDLTMLMVPEDTGLKMFESNQLHWDGSPFSTIPVDAINHLKGEEKLQISPVLATQWIRVNIDHSPFQSQELRQAFAYAIDRQSIVDHIGQGNQIPATGIVPIAMNLQDQHFFKDGDTETASQLFEDALNNLGISRKNFPEITLMYASAERNHLIAQELQAQWRKAFDIHIGLEPVENKVFFDRVSKKNYTLSLGNWFADFNDPINFLEVFKSKEVGTNNTNWEHPSYTELLETSFVCNSPEERLKLLKQSQEIIINDMPVIPIFHFTMLYTQDEHLKDVILTPMGHIDFKYAQLK